MDNGNTKLDRQTIAKKRWCLLGEMLRSKRCRLEDTPDVSVRRFATFDLIQTELIQNSSEAEPYSWFRYTSEHHNDYSADIRHLDGKIDWKSLLGFNNTGNVCVWPSEEVLTYYCLHHRHLFTDKRICELGGGMTCLAGIALAVCCDIEEMLLTDGNEQSVENVKEIISRNSEIFKAKSVKARMVKWDDRSCIEDYKEAFDTIVCADCLFFDEARKDLIETMDFLLKPGGEAIMFAPSRNDTFGMFRDLAQSRFTVVTKDNYDKLLWDLHSQNLAKGEQLYDSNIHYPLYMNLKKHPKSPLDSSSSEADNNHSKSA